MEAKSPSLVTLPKRRRGLRRREVPPRHLTQDLSDVICVSLDQQPSFEGANDDDAEFQRACTQIGQAVFACSFRPK